MRWSRWRSSWIWWCGRKGKEGQKNANVRRRIPVRPARPNATAYRKDGSPANPPVPPAFFAVLYIAERVNSNAGGPHRLADGEHRLADREKLASPIFSMLY